MKAEFLLIGAASIVGLTIYNKALKNSSFINAITFDAPKVLTEAELKAQLNQSSKSYAAPVFIEKAQVTAQKQAEADAAEAAAEQERIIAEQKAANTKKMILIGGGIAALIVGVLIFKK